MNLIKNIKYTRTNSDNNDYWYLVGARIETPGDLTTLKLGKKKELFTHWGLKPLKSDGTSWPPNTLTTSLANLYTCGGIKLNSNNLLDFGIIGFDTS